MLRRTFVGSSLVLGCASTSRGSKAPARRSWAERRAEFRTRLRALGPAPGEWKPQATPEGAREVRLPGATGELLAWYAAPPGAVKVPALVYFHGEFSLARWDFNQVRPFLAAGFAVLTPSLRGENGNPGAFELLMGEVDDAVAAVRWIAGRPEVDASRIYTLGHSVGGGVSGLLSLVPDVPVAVTGSVGGVYSVRTFGKWASDPGTAPLVRFDPTNRDETELRVLGANLADMVRPHRAYVGVEDLGILDNARAVRGAATASAAPFTLTEIAGDHAKSLQPGIRAFLEDVTRRTG